MTELGSRTRSTADPRALAALAAVGAAPEVLDDAGDWTVDQLTGGWSRTTYRVAHRHDPARRLAVRVQPHGSLLETEIAVEHRTYEALARTSAPVPTPLGARLDADHAFGGPFFVMDWVEGTAHNVWSTEDRVALERDWAAGGAVAGSLADTLARIHALPVEDFAFLGDRRGLAASADRWQQVYRAQAMVPDPVVEEAFAWLREQPEGTGPPVLVHGDYRIGNTLVRDGRVAGVIDWELAHVGDPHHDLGWLALEYLGGRFLGPGSGLLGGVAERDWFLRRYEQASGRTVDPDLLRAYTVLAAAALSAILCTGLRTYAEGRTDDLRMVWNRFALPVLRADLVRMMAW